MKYEKAIDYSHHFLSALSEGDNSLIFTGSVRLEVIGPDRHMKDPQYWEDGVPTEASQKQSGVYMIIDDNDELLYVGKARKANMAAEIWSKFAAATSRSPVYFRNSPLAKYPPPDNPEIAEILRRGEVRFVALLIEPKEFSSLFEVFIQTICAVNSALPPFNKQIG